MQPPSVIPPQVVRILLLALGIVLSYSVARALLTPPSFGQFGFYRGDAVREATMAEPVYAGQAECASCHDEEAQQVAAHGHKSLSCEACHGPGQAHSQNPEVKPQILNYSHCVRCHEANPSRPKWHKQVNSKDHYTGETCTACHVPHNPAEVP